MYSYIPIFPPLGGRGNSEFAPTQSVGGGVQAIKRVRR
eukprot:SAG11_NODE_29215_length_313_cov_0.953271_1_plen_37_part_01